MKQEKDKKARKNRRRQAKKRLRLIRKELTRTERINRSVFFLLQGIVLLVLIASVANIFLRRDIPLETSLFNIMNCVSAFILMSVPAIIKHRFKIYIPSVLQLVAVLLIFAHFIVGEVYRAYDHVFLFDKVLHTTNGIAFALLGFSMINIINNRDDAHKKLAPGFVAIFSFAFSLAASYIWELFEFSIDSIFKLNMQRWKDGLDVSLGGSGVNAYTQGTGLIDTMVDMIVMAVGGLAVSLVGYFSLKSKRDIFSKLLLINVSNYEVAKQKALKYNNPELLNAVKDIHELNDDLEKEDINKKDQEKSKIN